VASPTLSLVTTAQEAAERYNAFLASDALIQNGWHDEQDGRQLACALGVLGEEVEGAKDCPATVMPRWLAQMVPGFFDCQRFEDAKDWGRRFYEQLARLGGDVPFNVVHDWQAHTVGPLAVELAEKRGRDVEPHKALAEMQRKALTGQKFTADEWRPILKDAFYDIYLCRYDADADADANADADAYAYANAKADAYAYADANAYTNADADAYA